MAQHIFCLNRQSADKDEAALAALALVAGVVGYSEHCAF
jgi:hypothetical protein